MYTEYGYIGRADGILYATESEAREANEDNHTRAEMLSYLVQGLL